MPQSPYRRPHRFSDAEIEVLVTMIAALPFERREPAQQLVMNFGRELIDLRRQLASERAALPADA